MTYEGYVKRILERRRLALALSVLTLCLSVLVAVLYGVGVYLAFLRGTLEGISLLFLSGIPFVILSIIRAVLSFPRPYEVYSFDMPTRRLRRGKSFPSRHAFSSFIIAGALLSVSYILSSAVAFLGLVICFLRVSLGYHFLRDVAAGALIGLLSSLIGLAVFFA